MKLTEQCLGLSLKAIILQKQTLHIILIVIVSLLVYSNTFHVPFHFDDRPNILENSNLKNLSNLSPSSESRWFGFLTFALNFKLGVLNVIGYHIVNLIIHILNTMLVYYLVVLTFKTPYFRNHSVTTSTYQCVKNSDTLTLGHSDSTAQLTGLFSALLFVSHPIQTEAVTYIVQRFTSLATLFYLLSLVMYIKWRLKIEQQTSRAADYQEKRKNYCTVALLLYCASLISAILAMKTKEIAFTLPVIITFYEFVFFDGNVKKRILYLIPILLTMLIIPLSLIGIDKPIGDAIGELRKAAQETGEIPRWSYLFTQFRIIVTYIRLLFLPINQNLDYDYPTYDSFFNPQVFLCFMLLLLIFGFGIYFLYITRSTLYPRTYLKCGAYAIRLIAFGILWFFVTLSVESSIIPIRDVIFEHRVYLPSVGFFITFVSLIQVIKGMLKNRITLIEKAVVPVIVLMVITLSIAAYARNTVWQDEVRLWENVVKKSPDKPRPHYNLGLYYEEHGRTDEALMEYQTASNLNPDCVEAHNNMGMVYISQGQIEEAIKEFQTALRFNPDYAKAHNNLGIVYSKQKRFEEAIKEFKIALKLQPDYAKAHNNLGMVYSNQGRFDDAIKEFQTALRLNPDYTKARQNLETLYNAKKSNPRQDNYY